MTAVLDKARPMGRPELMNSGARPPVARPTTAPCNHGPKCTVCALMKGALENAQKETAK